MADVYTPAKRSRVMAAIRSCDTEPERRLRHWVRDALGHRWRTDRNVRALPGQPDILVPGLRLAIFLDGCFFHCCPRHGRVPKSNRAYWATKLARNVRRDETNRRRLRRMGYATWRVWEHSVTGANPNGREPLAARLRLRAAQTASAPAPRFGSTSTPGRLRLAAPRTWRAG